MKVVYFFPIVFFLLAGVHISAQQDAGPPSSADEYEKQYQDRIRKDRLFGIYIPKNLDDAMDQLDKLTSPESRARFKNMPEDSVCIKMHASLGQWMIRNWGFYEGSRLSHYLRSAGVTFPDDMADFLILAYHRRLHNLPFSIKELAPVFREKRQKAYEEEKKDGKIIYEEKRKKND